MILKRNTKFILMFLTQCRHDIDNTGMFMCATTLTDIILKCYIIFPSTFTDQT